MLLLNIQTFLNCFSLAKSSLEKSVNFKYLLQELDTCAWFRRFCFNVSVYFIYIYTIYTYIQHIQSFYIISMYYVLYNICVLYRCYISNIHTQTYMFDSFDMGQFVIWIITLSINNSLLVDNTFCYKVIKLDILM